MTDRHEKIDYIELPAKDFAATKQFFSTVFNWKFTDYSESYIAFYGAGIDGGFYLSDLCSTTANGSALTVFYSEQLETTRDKITQANGKIVQAIFPFPGGRRFHFYDPNGNEYAVWSD